MNIGPIGPLNIPIPGISGTGAGGAVHTEGTKTFGSHFEDAVSQLNRLQKDADAATVEVASGQTSDLHSALVKVEEASLALQLAIQVRNKVLESYQEIMRMQV